MSTIMMSQLEKELNPSAHDTLLYFNAEQRLTKQITIGQLLGLQQAVLNKPCQYCGSRGAFDVRGNCGACGGNPE